MARKQKIPQRQIGPVFEVPSFYPHIFRAGDRMFELHRQLGLQRMTEDDLAPYQRQILHDLEKAVGLPTSKGFDTLLRPGRINFAELHADGYRFTKPKISLRCFITTKRNLSVTWHPYHLDLNFRKIPAPEWIMRPLGESNFDRPDDELMFIRELGWLRKIVPDIQGRSITVDICLLSLAIAAWNDLKSFLSWHFDVQVIQEPLITIKDRTEYGLESNPDTFEGSNDIAGGFDITNTVEVERNRLDALPANFPSTHGISVEDFWETIQSHRYDHGGLHSERASKALRKMGGDKLTPSVVEKLEKDLLSAIEARVWSPGRKVVQLRPHGPLG